MVAKQCPQGKRLKKLDFGALRMFYSNVTASLFCKCNNIYGNKK